MHAVIAKLTRFEGKQVIACFDEIAKIAAGYTINIIDPEFNTGSIDEDSRRLNIRTDGNSIITSFTIG